MSADPAIDVSDVTKRFPGVVALDRVSFAVQGGHVAAVVGENGAGKSTLMAILAGLQRPDSGRVRLNGVEVRHFDPRELLSRYRVALVPQELVLCTERTVAENVFLGIEPAAGPFPSRRDMLRHTAEILEPFQQNIDPAGQVSRLTIAEQQLVLVARALARDCRILILDEPTAVLTPVESARLFKVIAGLRERGVTIVYVSHRIPEVFEIADAIHVLRDGRAIASWPTAEATPDEVIRAMVGRKLAEEERAIAESRTQLPEVTDAAVRLRALSGRGFGPVTIAVPRGEILGLAGLPDSGRTELLRTIFADLSPTEGSIEVGDRRLAARSPAGAIKAGIAYVPAERQTQGILPTMSVGDNLRVLSFHHAGFMARSERKRSGNVQAAERLRIRFSSLGQDVRQLSGGNQQKVVLARWLTIQPKLLLLDEPTRGIDVGAKAEIYALLDELRQSGVGVILSSSDLAELLRICDRIAVMRGGIIVRAFDREEASEEAIVVHATGVMGAAA